MPMADNLASTSLVLSIAIAAIAVILGVRQWFERQVRELELSEADRNHFSRQDLRRWLGVLLLLILAIGVLVGSRIEPVTVPWEVLYGVLTGGGVLVDSG